MIWLLESARKVSVHTGRVLPRHVALSSIARRSILLAVYITAAVILTTAFFTTATIQAAPINYGDFMGNTVIYQMVREDSNSGDTPPLFGMPSISADTLDFDPVGFGAHAMGAGGVDVTDGNLAFMVKAKAGQGISNLLIQERGDTTLSGFGTDATFTSVTMSGILNISEIGFSSINTASIPISITNFAPSGGNFGLTTDFGGGPGGTLPWNGSLLYDLTPANPTVAAVYAAAGRSTSLPITKISVNFDNTLVALSQLGTSALIAKKDNGITIRTNTPEPASCALALFGFALGLAATRRSR
jgi:hypothetical protein